MIPITLIAPNLAIATAEAATKAVTSRPPAFRSETSVFNPAWLVLGAVAIWIVASRGGRK